MEKKNEEKNIYKNKKISSKNNVEGLGYDNETNSLIIAFKNKAGLKDEKKVEKVRRVYKYNLKAKKIEKEPFLEISLKDLEKKYNLKTFMPSGIAYRPFDKKFYVISAVGSSLLVLNRKSKVVAAKKLDPTIFRQPEGICVSALMDKPFFIANEGKE